MNLFKKSLIVVFLFVGLICCNSNADQKEKKVTSEASAVTETKTKKKDSTWTVYHNERFNYCIRYPKAVLRPKEGSSNGDGYIFSSKNGLKLTVSAFHKAGISLSDTYDMMLTDNDYDNINYKRLDSSAFTIKGFSDSTDNYYYVHVMDHGQDFIMFEFEYPRAQEEKYASTINQILERGIQCRPAFPS